MNTQLVGCLARRLVGRRSYGLSDGHSVGPPVGCLVIQSAGLSDNQWDVFSTIYRDDNMTEYARLSMLLYFLVSASILWEYLK